MQAEDEAGSGGAGKKGRATKTGASGDGGEGDGDARLEGRLREISRKIISGGALGKAYEALGLLDALVARVSFCGHRFGSSPISLCVYMCYLLVRQPRASFTSLWAKYAPPLTLPSPAARTVFILIVFLSPTVFAALIRVK